MAVSGYGCQGRREVADLTVPDVRPTASGAVSFRPRRDIAAPAEPALDAARSDSSVPEYQDQNDDRDRNAEKPKKNALTHGLPPIVMRLNKW